MYIVMVEEDDFPYPSKISAEVSSFEGVIEYMISAYEQGYKIVSLVNDDSFYGKM